MSSRAGSGHAVAAPGAWNSMLSPAAGVLATTCSATALTAVIEGATWFGYVLVASLLIAATGIVLRSLHAPTVVVGLGQIAALLLLVTGSFTERALAAVIPGSDAFGELDALLGTAFDQIRTGLPPVAATPGILCLVTIAMGLVAIVVDTLIVPLGAPAVSGLVLLCVYAVPSSLSERLLPWWPFVLGAGAFAALLAVHGKQRHRTWRTREVPTNTIRTGAAATPLTILGLALVIGLVAGSAITGVGTVGRLPGSGGNPRPVAGGGLGIHPFTTLRGLLNRDEEVPLFRVQGLGGQQRKLRAFTLSSYQPNEGWTLPDGPMPPGIPARQPFPAPEQVDLDNEISKIDIEPINWMDVWLPVYDIPVGLQGIERGWNYDPDSGTVFRKNSKRPGSYTEFADISRPTREQLRESDSASATVAGHYSQISRVDPRVEALAGKITADAATRYDKARALWKYFGPQNGFSYSLQTAPASDTNALADFLLNGKRGYCEQYASSMAVMLRALDIPSRVAVGFTAGNRDGEHRTITTHDAHAWVEVYFSNVGWVSFDPTPLADGRGSIPPYLEDRNSGSGGSAESGGTIRDGQNEQSPPPEQRLSQPSGTPAAQTSNGGGFPERAPTWAGWTAVAVVLLAAALSITTLLIFRRIDRVGTPQRAGVTMSRLAAWLPAASAAAWMLVLLLVGWQVHWTLALALALLSLLGIGPALLREILRRRRLHSIITEGPGSAEAAWEELVDECADRGLTIAPGDTLRSAARKVTNNNRLDDAGKEALGTVVGAAERHWYAPATVGQRESGLARAFTRMRYSLVKETPMPLRAKLLPRSVLNRIRRS